MSASSAEAFFGTTRPASGFLHTKIVPAKNKSAGTETLSILLFKGPPKGRGDFKEECPLVASVFPTGASSSPVDLAIPAISSIGWSAKGLRPFEPEESKETAPGFVAHDFVSQSLVCYTFASG
mgnify:CR=1 FL=1